MRFPRYAHCFSVLERCANVGSDPAEEVGDTSDIQG